ncbi:accessory factor UbiK family protein [Thiomicrorhabdus aquaedulcis]|uniref:accessory factor UbiK family protein n=1 Tax=Thiomicrorhabdus aquaedulcis TaxID=2211106 RepID=UPI000FDA66F8|nr:accessory factor UbiK family protein [Thiomicrorhabdus aquaedulcis]
MFNPHQLEALAQKIAEAIPPALGNLPSGVQDHIKAVLSRAFEKMDLVSREEFDVQSAVLAKTRQKLEALEQKVAQWENSSHDV